jgi:hypothetical protein
MGGKGKRVALYLRVSTDGQTTKNQQAELASVAERCGWHVVKVYRDHGISGAKGRDKRPAFDALCRDFTKRQFDVVMAWSVDRLGRSLQDLVAFSLSFRSGGKPPCGFISALRTMIRSADRHLETCSTGFRQACSMPVTASRGMTRSPTRRHQSSVG